MLKSFLIGLMIKSRAAESTFFHDSAALIKSILTIRALEFI